MYTYRMDIIHPSQASVLPVREGIRPEEKERGIPGKLNPKQLHICLYLKWGANLLSWVAECTKCKHFLGLQFPCLPTEQQTLANRVNWSINYLMTSNLSSFYLIFLSRTCKNVLSSHSIATPAHFFLPPQTRTCNTKPVILKEIKGIITKTSYLSKNLFPFWSSYPTCLFFSPEVYH